MKRTNKIAAGIQKFIANKQTAIFTRWARKIHFAQNSNLVWMKAISCFDKLICSSIPVLVFPATNNCSTFGYLI